MKVHIFLIIFVSFKINLMTSLPVDETTFEPVTMTTDSPDSNEISDTTEGDTKIERIEKIERLSEQAMKNDTSPKKSQRNFPVYYVESKVNGRFGKSLRAFTSEEFHEQYPAIN